MPTIHDERDKLEQLKRELEQGGEMTSSDGAIVLTGAQIDGNGFSWIEVMPTVENARNGDWFFTVTSADLGVLADYIQANPDRIPIDYDHAGANDGSTRAAGWFTGEAKVVQAGDENPSGEVQDRESVWAQVKWTPTAVDEIRGGDFRFISPEWHFGAKDPKTGLMTKLKDLAAATLTNRPFFKELAPVTARLFDSEQLDQLAEAHGSEIADLLLAAQGDDDDKFTAALGAALAAGGNPSATDQGTEDDPKETTMAEAENQVTDYMKMLGLDESVDPKHRLAAAFRDKDEKILALTQQVTELTAATVEKDGKASELATRVAELEQKDRARDIELVLARAVEKGRVIPAEKDTLAEVFASDVDGLRRLIATRPADMFNPEPKGTAGEPDRFIDDPDVSQFVKTFATSDPVDTEQAKQHLAAMEILKEQGKADNYTNDEYVAAYEQAKSLVY